MCVVTSYFGPAPISYLTLSLRQIPPAARTYRETEISGETATRRRVE